MNSNTKKLIGIAALAALGLYLWKKSQSSANFEKGTAKVTNSDGTTSLVPAWFEPAYTVTDASGKKTQVQSTVPDTYYATSYSGPIGPGYNGEPLNLN